MWQNINDESDGRVCHSYKSFVGKLFPNKQLKIKILIWSCRNSANIPPTYTVLSKAYRNKHINEEKCPNFFLKIPVLEI